MTLAVPISTLPTQAVSDGCIHAASISMTIDDRPILRDICLDIHAGQFIALLGANGAGKSTLLRILSTLVVPTSGTLKLFGLSTASAQTAVRARIGLVGHQSMLYADLTALENLEFFGKLYNVKAPRTRALHLLNLLGLARRANDRVKSFSRGMAQRVSIARALMHDPELLLADEPFAGLDAPSADTLERILASLHDTGKTILLANHDITQSLRLTDRAIVLVKGKKLFDAPSSSLDPAHVLFHMERSGS